MFADTAGTDTSHDGSSSGLPPLIFVFNVMGHITEQALGSAIPDISGANARIIMLIAHNDSRGVPTYQSDIRDCFSTTRSTSSRVIKLMEQKGWITCSASTRDARKIRLHLTKKAVIIANKIDAASALVQSQMLEGIDPGTVSQVTSAILRMRANLGKHGVGQRPAPARHRPGNKRAGLHRNHRKQKYQQ